MVTNLQDEIKHYAENDFKEQRETNLDLYENMVLHTNLALLLKKL